MNNIELFNELLVSVQEAGKIMRGELKASREYPFDESNVKSIREHIGFPQSRFSLLIGVSMQTVQNGEQGHRHPTEPAKVLLRFVQADPESVFKRLT